MLISPLMGPILAAGLSLAAADLYLGLKSMVNIVISIIGSIGFAGFLVWILPFQTATTEILARTQPNLLDLGVALLSGLAGSLVVVRGGGGGGVTALPGVAIAVALMPPLCAVGFGVGSGFTWNIMAGAGLLFLTNLAAIISAAFLVFFGARMDSPDVRRTIDEEIARRFETDRLYLLLKNTRMAESFGHVGKLRWRVTMLVAVLVLLFLPLRRALNQVRDEAVARRAVQEAVRRIAAPEEVVTQQIDINQERVLVRMVVTEPVDPQVIEEVERNLIRATTKGVTLSVRRVAAEEDVAYLRERLRGAIPVMEQPLSAIQQEMVARLERPLRQAWPSNRAELLRYELGFSPQGAVVRLLYTAEEPLQEGAAEVMQRVLRANLGSPDLILRLEYEPPGLHDPPPEVRPVR
jgi:uncharacterized hydrophobic protein (TIGR00271 family)